MAAASTKTDTMLSNLTHQMNMYCPDSNDELWRECAAWLTRWEMLRNDHKANWPEACIADLANILRDGVLLCKLVNKMDPGCIDMKDVNLKPTLAQFLCLRNINLFLEACVDKFGLKQSDLFEDTMLFDLTNFHRVLCTLSKLSLSYKSLKSKIPGFSAQRLKSKEDEVIYQSLKTVEMPVRARSMIENDMTKEEIYEEIYQDLCVDRSAIEQPPTFEKRDFVIKELLDTEKNYVEVLSKLKNNFMQPLMSQMKAEHHNVVFFKIQELRDIHLEFLHELLSVRQNPAIRLSHVFLRWRDKFLTYGMYCANLTKATTVLQELCDTDEIFNQTVIKYEKEDNNGRFKLRDVLSVPMQRILKYHLLLDKLIENTDPNHEEYNDLRRAREAMLDVAGYINEAARDSEHLEVINNLQETITEWNLSSNQKLSDYGRLLKDASLKIKAHDDQKTRSRYVFIFDKCILICKQLKGNQFAFRDLLNTIEYHVEETHNRPILIKEARTSYHFLLVKNDNQNAYTIFVRTIELKQQIIKAIKDALDNIQPQDLQRTSHKFELHTFEQPCTCFFCSKYLKGLLCQGYRCSVCSITVHKACIKNTGKCGQHHHPPGGATALNATSTTLPTTSTIVRAGANTSSSSCNAVNSNATFDSTTLEDKLWFVGEMDRTTASIQLENRENGTFLVRIRPQNDDKDVYALTLKTDNTVKHMKICCKTEPPGDTKKYYLSQSKFFSSIEELVLNYQNYSLKENFERLDENTKLLWPFRQLRALVKRNHEAKDTMQKSVMENQQVLVVGMEGYRDGWWKVRSCDNSSVGYVPAAILNVEEEVRFN